MTTLQLAGAAANALLSGMRTLRQLPRPVTVSRTVKEHIVSATSYHVVLSMLPSAVEATRLAEQKLLWKLAQKAPTLGAEFDAARAKLCFDRLRKWIDGVRNTAAAHHDREVFADWLEAHASDPLDFCERVEGSPMDVYFVGGLLPLRWHLLNPSNDLSDLIAGAAAFVQLVERACIGYASEPGGSDAYPLSSEPD